MTYYLKIFNQGYENYQCRLTEGEEISLGSEFGCNIYLANLKTEGKITLVLDSESVIFNTVPPILKQATGDGVVTNEKYSLPIFLVVNDTQLVIAKSSDTKLWSSLSAGGNLIDFESIANISEESDLGFYDADAMLDSSINDNENLSGIDKLLRRISKWLTKCYKANKNVVITSITILSFCIVIMGISASLINSSHAETESMESQQQQQLLLRREFSKLHLHYPALTFTTSEGGVSYINGVVNSESDIELITKTFALFKGEHMKLNIYQLSSTLNLINLMIRQANLGKLVAIYENADNQIQLRGVTNNLSKLNDLEIEINKKLPGLGEIDISQIYDYEQLTKDLYAAFGNYKALLDRGSLKLREDVLHNWYIMLGGYLAINDQRALISALNAFQQKYPLIKIEHNYQDLMSALPFKISTVYTGDPAYVELENNQKLFIGDSEMGFHVDEITSAVIKFSGKINLDIPIDSLVGSDKDSSSSGVDPVSREGVITEELDKERKSIIEEQQYIERLVELRQNINDKSMVNFINKQISGINSDIDAKRHDIDAYSKGT